MDKALEYPRTPSLFNRGSQRWSHFLNFAINRFGCCADQADDGSARDRIAYDPGGFIYGINLEGGDRGSGALPTLE